ncbi:MULTISPECIES: DUF5666 domain-containing protein [unclassified Pseudomonas]|uniref:DUF5666 domain-containing protein n=1 Tax=unclassified Pseudomonas TaxID=196821 RepID=UPI00121EA267|nr:MULTISPECIES: DUF5666 domain-containing protein [unclassified Pseudomonas]MBD8596382.1 hypothetical protein [Pseudomonas sp. CFBP 8772]RZI68265.1 MAG: hypothetical protein EOP13_25925 [Pseudomonas sp.]
MKTSRTQPLRHALLLSGLLGALLSAALPAHAEDGKPTRVRGAITAIEGDSLKIHSNRGEDLQVALTPDTQIRGVTLAQVSEIKPGSYIGSAAVPLPDGSLKALEVHVFPPAMAGTGDGHRAFDLTPDSTMTNGSVGDLVASTGRTITVNYKGGQKKIVIPDDVPIVNLVPGDRSLLKPGVKVVLQAQKGAANTLTALSISAGENGVTPPM